MSEKYMKYFRKVVWFVLLFSTLLLAFVIIRFQVDDMTLSKGKVYEFNENWVMTWENGKSVSLEKLPYLGESKAGEIVWMENRIPEEYFGKTMSFLSADKTLKVWMDGECVYEFGTRDKRSFGQTPGSIVNFIDIPEKLTNGELKIEMSSPYDNYSAMVTEVTVGERDVLILQLLRDNLFNIACNILILICGIIFFLLFLIQRILHKNTEGMQYICGYCVVAALYYSIETKILHIFYGNQTFYSVMVFLCLMLIPFFIGLYYANGVFRIYHKRWQVLLALVCINIGVQMVLQLCNLVDFMSMAFLSHALIMLTILLVAKSYIDIIKEDSNVSIKLGMAALLFMGGGGAIDIVRMYIIAIGDMGKFSRLGTCFYSSLMLYQHIRKVVVGYDQDMERSAKLLQQEMEAMEKKNEQLERANAQAEEARRDAIAADEAKGKFLAHMSHEIRTPINAVLGMDTMILRETEDPQIKEYALDIQNAGKNLLALINDILDFSKIESGKLEIIQVEYDFSSMIHDISNMLKAKVEAKNLKLNIYVNEKLPSKLLGDDVRIRQVLVNLLNNAVKYTQQGSVTLRIDGKVEGRKVNFDFSVEDTGIGIKEEDIAKLFQEFQRIEEKRNRNVEGTGLGLNITTQLLGLMGSKINVESVYGKGSRFYFSMEQQIVDSTPVGNLEERIRKQSTEYDYMATFVAPHAHILVVDDNIVNLKVFVSLLKQTRVNVDVADSGSECLKLIAEKHYDLIFLDHMMPEMDGIEVLHRMKGMEKHENMHTPIVALTANAITGAKEMYLKEGFDAFLPKPINPEKLEQTILRLLPRELLLFDVEQEELKSQGVSGQEEKGNSEKGVLADKDNGWNVLGSDTVSGKGIEYDKRSGGSLSTSFEESPELPMIDGIDWSYGRMHLPSQELLLETVEDFYKAIEVEAKSLETFYQGIAAENMREERREAVNEIEKSEQAAKSLQQYRIKVHGMKSSANMIGAIVLGGMAKVLENAAKDADIHTIEKLHNVFMQEWLSYTEKLKVCVPQKKTDDGEVKDVEDYAVVLDYMELLQQALEELDIDEMDRIMELLESFSYPEDMQERIGKLGALVVNMDSEQAFSVIEELVHIIKNNEEWRQ